MENLTEINGKVYPMWQQFVDKKSEWVGGSLINVDKIMGSAETVITDVRLVPNGKESAMIEFVGEDFTCSCDVRYCGIGGPPSSHTKHLCVDTQWGDSFLISKAENEKV
jgi:hypothetical protein